MDRYIHHPSADLHHIKKENIGLIEVMGLAVLPASCVRQSISIVLVVDVPCFVMAVLLW
ncbi:hypothetical protein [Anaerosacchariphilus polymeriproducens]|uniref:hypothetical protein n=1 Tax=Anaerosacchariphilus polymeriproducens TaxID=1812858 RepID=UPI0012D7C60A|nr:hypothetical protein [Anaerosacchariphilus polymeriproducens]